MMLKNLTANAANLAANAKIEDMSRLFKNHMAGKPDVKNALSGVMVLFPRGSALGTRTLNLVPFLGNGEEPVAEAVRGAGRGAGHDKAVFPRRWKWPEEDLPGKVVGAAEPSLRPEPLHPDHGHAHQNVRHVASQSRCESVFHHLSIEYSALNDRGQFLLPWTRESIDRRTCKSSCRSIVDFAYLRYSGKGEKESGGKLTRKM